MAPTAPCGDVAPPAIDDTWECLLRRPGEEDKGHRQACVRLSKVTWGNIIATHFKRFDLGRGWWGTSPTGRLLSALDDGVRWRRSGGYRTTPKCTGPLCRVVN